MLKRLNLQKTLLYSFLFYIIYTPSIAGTVLIDKNITIPVITVVLLALDLLRSKREKLFDKTKVAFATLITASNIFSLLSYIAHTDNFNIIESRIVQGNLVLCYLVIISIIFKYAKSRKIKKHQLLDWLINLAVFQGVLCLLMLIIPALHNFALLFYSGDNFFVRTYRIYGITSDYTFATPIYHGFIAAMFLYSIISTKAKLQVQNILKIAFILLAVFVNGRTGVAIFIGCSILLLMADAIRTRRVRRLIKHIALFVAAAIASALSLKIIAPVAYMHFNTFVAETTRLVFNQQASGTYAILNDSASLPSGIDLLFGSGVHVYDSGNAIEAGYKSSDIGYINDLHLGGIAYIVFLYGAYLYLIFKSIKDPGLRIALILMMLSANYKGEIFRSSIIIFLILYVCLMENYNEN